MPRDQQPKPRGHPYQPLNVQSSHQPHSGATHQGRHRQPQRHSQQRDSRRHSSQHFRQVRPVYNQATVSQAEVRDSRAENLYRDSVCELCSEPGHEMFHHHVSSQSIREFASRYQAGYLFSCLMCNSQESIIRPATRKLILTSSTLYNVWTRDMKLALHIDIESIVGGRVRNLTRALIKLYLVHPERLEIILIAGLNNIGEGQSAKEVMEEIAELRLAVKAHSVMNDHAKPSVLSVSTLLYAPKYCSLEVPQNCTEWIPPAGFENKRGVMEAVNEGIKSMNIENKVNYLKLHMEGIRLERGKAMHKHYPAKPIWRELEVRRRLHLTPEYKEKVCRKAAQLFSGGLTNIGDWPK